ncbi:MAG: hypothetical protein QNK24_11605 [Desulfuromusa sp.]|nr:hypothetical protein [Desulfuromusa sp.]
MQTVKAPYKERNIQLLTPIQEVDEAELFIIVLDKYEQAIVQAKIFSPQQSSSEQGFKPIGLASFFDGNEDNNVDWGSFFNVKAA